jgi:hypothetical protein
MVPIGPWRLSSNAHWLPDDTAFGFGQIERRVGDTSRFAWYRLLEVVTIVISVQVQSEPAGQLV